MRLSRVRLAVAAVFVLFALAVTWPGALLVAEPGPLVFGLPRALAWYILWILIGLAALLVLDHFESRAGDD
ncbi:hypothetical protein [Thioalkalivibrio sp. XN8]|uniref:hypothetical protein n=1 Tax=Thioalkalivibrio sp. XN8 TaxID=2712863 RepID=UPI0013EC918D|nr:hypothetical protein [Thioalkalivibrio sp. XN8]NGP52330.1 hypothetical protein [Thioalkalivibrio sp. XN8]